MSMKQAFVIGSEEAGQRLDVFCAVHIPQFSRATIQKAIKLGTIRLNEAIVKPRTTLQEGQQITVNIDTDATADVTLTPVAMPIIYEDKDVVVINKPAGVSVHLGQGTRQYTVVDWLMSKYVDISNVGDVREDGTPNDRPGIVHRLDKDTSGVLIMAKTQQAFEVLKEQFKRRSAKKEYLALVFGVPGETSGRIVRALARSKRNPLRRTIDEAGKEAITEWRRQEKFGTRFALLRVYPLTGRTHQIRVHLHFLGFPIVGDNLYTFKRQKSPQGVRRQLLHAEKLTVTMVNGDKRSFIAPLSNDFSTIIDQLRHEYGKPIPKTI